MSDNEMAIVVLSIIFGSIFAIIVVIKLIGLAKTWINRNNASYNEETFDRLAKAFIKHKKETDRRLQNIEAIVTDDEPKSKASSNRELKQSQLHNTIEIKPDEGKE